VPEGGLEAAQEDLQENTKRRRTRTEKTPTNPNDNDNDNDNGGIIGERCRQ
jgi:hypothetical protein